MLGSLPSCLPASHLLPPTPTASSVASCRSPHPIRACLWRHPRGEIVTEICSWPARPSVTRLVFARLSCCFLSSQTTPVAAASAHCCLCASSSPSSPSACQPHLEAFAAALPHCAQVPCSGSGVFTVATPGPSSTRLAPSGPAPPRPFCLSAPSPGL